MASRIIFRGSVSAFALLLSSQAFAQTAEVPADAGVEPQAAASDVGAEDEIVVTGVRASIVGAINSRKNSVQIVDSIVAEDVGKLPDNNVVEALQRVSGIQVTDRAGGETAAITIRGLTDPLTTMNGRNIFTAANTSFSLQDISANLVKQVDVYKTRAADQIETGLAGQIDVKTRRPLDFDGFTISGLARGIYNEQADKFNPNVALLVSDRWETGIGEIGLLVNGSYSKTNFRNQSVASGAMVPFATETPPAGSGFTPLQRIFPGPVNAPLWQQGRNEGLPTAPGSTLNINGTDVPYYLSRDAVIIDDLYGERERPAVNAALQWAPNSSSVYTAEFFYSGFRGNTFNSKLFSFADWWGDLGPNPGATFDLYEGTNIIKSREIGSVAGFNSGDYATNKTDSFLYALNAKWDVGTNGKITADLAYQDSTNETSFFAVRTNRGPLDIDVDFNDGSGMPAFSFTDNPGMLTDPSQWTVAEMYDNGNRSTGSALTFMLDGEYNWDEGFLRKIKAGFRYDDRKAASFNRLQDAGILGASLASFGDGAAFTNSDFFQGRANVPTAWTLMSGDYIANNADALRTRWRAVNPLIETSDQMTLDRVFDINEITTAAYVQADGEVSIFGRPLKVQGGVRFVAIDTDYNFYDRLRNFAQTRVSTGSTKFLPSFTARYEITDNFRARFNYGQTLRRPAFADLNPNYTLTGDLSGLGKGSGSAGTATLRATESTNYDFALEWYFERNSAIYATLFSREIDGLVVPLTIQEYIPNNGIVAGATDYFMITRPQNASSGVLKGVELGFTYFPTYLPSVLDGLGFTGSVTILDSKQNIPDYDNDGNLVGQSESSFFGVSDLSYNATLAYDRGIVGARLSYIWRKEFLSNNEQRLFANPIGMWRKPENSLDFQLTLNVNDRIGLTFDAVNLTNSKQQTYYKFEDVGNAEQFNMGTLLFARTFAIGARFKFD